MYQDAQELRAIRKNNSQIEIQVEWEGLTDNVDLTWEPLQQFHEDLPGLLEIFLQSAGHRKLKEEAQAQCLQT